MHKLITFSYAGSFGYSYQNWLPILQNSVNIQLHMIDYYGRGKQYNKNFPNTWDELIYSTYDQVKEKITNDQDYILFGHSMGSKVAYDIYRLIEKDNLPIPKCIIFSGTQVFDIPSENFLSKPEEEFRNLFIKLGGISEQVVENAELSELVFQLLRQDLGLLQQFRFKNCKRSIDIPVIILNGDTDLNSPKEKWNQLFGKSCTYIVFQGGHFFIFSNKEQVILTLESVINKLL